MYQDSVIDLDRFGFCDISKKYLVKKVHWRTYIHTIGEGRIIIITSCVIIGLPTSMSL